MTLEYNYEDVIKEVYPEVKFHELSLSEKAIYKGDYNSPVFRLLEERDNLENCLKGIGNRVKTRYTLEPVLNKQLKENQNELDKYASRY